jgi:predicted nucleotidyltransferase
MGPSTALHKHRQAIQQMVRRHNATNARVFGSTAQGIDTEDSELDILIDPTSETSLFDIGAIRPRAQSASVREGRCRHAKRTA